MSCLAILLLASLVSAAPATLNKPEDEIHLQAQPIDAFPAAQLIPEKDHVSTENSSEETPISIEELGLKAEDVIKSMRRPKNQKLELLHRVPQEAGLRNAAPQAEETTEFTPTAATTPEGKLAKLGHKIGKNLDKTVKETMNYLKSLLPRAYEVTRP